MAIDPDSSTYGSSNFLRNAAVQLVDIATEGPNGQTSAEALVVLTTSSVPAGGATSALQTALNDKVSTAALQTTLNGLVATAALQTALNDTIGTVSDAAWNGTDPDATVISLLKAIAKNTET